MINKWEFQLFVLSKTKKKEIERECVCVCVSESESENEWEKESELQYLPKISFRCLSQWQPHQPYTVHMLLRQYTIPSQLQSSKLRNIGNTNQVSTDVLRSVLIMNELNRKEKRISYLRYSFLRHLCLIKENPSKVFFVRKHIRLTWKICTSRINLYSKFQSIDEWNQRKWKQNESQKNETIK
jgi:hypothetical protein